MDMLVLLATYFEATDLLEATRLARFYRFGIKALFTFDIKASFSAMSLVQDSYFAC